MKGYTYIQQVFDDISDDENQHREAKLEVGSLSKTMNQLGTGILSELWCVLLERLHAVSCSLQDSHMDLNTAVRLYRSLIIFVIALRDKFDLYESRGKEKFGNSDYLETTKRVPKRKKHFNEGSAPETVFTPSSRFKVF